MTDQDKKRIAEYMGWAQYKYPSYYLNTKGDIESHHFDLNDAGLVVQEMQKRGELHSFLMMDTFNQISSWSDFIADLFNAESFFSAMSEWLKEGKK
jgi:hypothetical protein